MLTYQEIVDTRPFCDEFTRKLTNNGNGNPELTNLPRKFNVRSSSQPLSYSCMRPFADQCMRP